MEKRIASSDDERFKCRWAYQSGTTNSRLVPNRSGARRSASRLCRETHDRSPCSCGGESRFHRTATKLHSALNRRHRRALGEWIAILQQITVKAISGGRRFYQFVQRLLGIAAICNEKSASGAPCRTDAPSLSITFFAVFLDRLAAFRIALLHDLVQRLHQRKIQTVEPEHRLARIVRVIMPGELRRENQIARLHDALLAVDRRISAIALKDKAQRRRRVAVRPGIFAGLYVLK
mgnify:CR=1 FL=1